MFNSLMKLALQTDFTMAFRATGPNRSLLCIVLMPAGKEGQDAALAQPVRLEGTVEELITGFDEAIARYGAARSTLVEQLDATVTVLKEAEDESASKAADKLKAKAKPVAAKVAARLGPAAAAGPAGDVDVEPYGNDVDDEDAASPVGSGGSACAPAAAAVATAPAEGGTNNLFAL